MSPTCRAMAPKFSLILRSFVQILQPNYRPKCQVTTKRLLRQPHLNLCQKKKDGLAVISLQKWNAFDLGLYWRMFTLLEHNSLLQDRKRCCQGKWRKEWLRHGFRKDSCGIRSDKSCGEAHAAEEKKAVCWLKSLGCFSISVPTCVYPLILSSEQRIYFMYPIWSDAKIVFVKWQESSFDGESSSSEESSSTPVAQRMREQQRKAKAKRQAAAAVRKANRPQPPGR